MTLHNPQRLEGESFSAYKARRTESNNAATAIVLGQRIAKNRIPATAAKTQRREEVKALGLRQMKRERYLVKHPEYAKKHPSIADRYSF